MPTISKRLTKKGEVRYLVQLRLKGCPPATATFSAKADARNWAQRTEVALRAARYGPAAAVADRKPGDTIDVTVDRGGQTRTVTAKVGSRSSSGG